MVWRFYEPISYTGYDDLSDEEWEAIKQPVEFRFDPKEYSSNIIVCIQKIKALLDSSEQTVELPIQNFSLEQLLAYEPIAFSSK